MRAIAIAALLLATGSAVAAPWSIQLPVGFSEEPVPDEQLAALRAMKETISVDAQAFSTAGDEIVLTRVTWLLKLPAPITRASIERFDREQHAAMDPSAQNFTANRSWIGPQMVATSSQDVGTVHIKQRRIYALAADGVVHLLSVSCFGARDDIAPCEASQRTMKITLPNPMAVPTRGVAKDTSSFGHKIGLAALVALVLGLVAWVFQSVRRGPRRRRRS
jgi:hypothetical protein